MSAVWDRTTEFLSDNVGAVATIAVLTIYLPGVAGSVLGPVQAAAEPGGTKLALAIAAFAFSLLTLFGQLALTALALDPTSGRGGALRTAARRFLPMIGVSILLLLVAIALIMPLLLPLAAEGVDFAAMSPGWTANLSPATIWFVSLYGIALLPLMLWVLARLSVVTGVVVAERRGVGALRRAWTLTGGLALRIVGAGLLLLVVGGVAVLAAQTVFGSVFRIIFGDGGAVNAATVLTAVLVGLVSTALSVILTAFLAKLYLAATARAEAAVPA